MESKQQPTPTFVGPHANKGKKARKLKQAPCETSQQQLTQRNQSNIAMAGNADNTSVLKIINNPKSKVGPYLTNGAKNNPHQHHNIKKDDRQEPNDKPQAIHQTDQPSKLTKSQPLDGLQKVNKSSPEYKKMLENYPIEKLASFMTKHGLEDPSNYASLSSDLFVKEIGGFYYCLLCCKRSRTQDDRTIDDHLESKQHVDEFMRLEAKLRLTPPKDNSVHLAAVDLLCNAWMEFDFLGERDREARTLAISEFSNILLELNPECSYRIIGSFLTGASQRNSDVNLELLHPNSKLFEDDPRARDSIHHKLIDPDADYGSQINNHTLHYDLIGNAVESLYKIGLVMLGGGLPFAVLSQLDDLTARVPELTLEHLSTKTILKVCCYAESSYKLTCLLRNYLHLDERALQLCILVKHWAHICHIANPKHGTFSSDTLAILVIHYLQRTEPPVLPCLHEMLRKKSQAKSGDKSTEGLEDRLGSLTLDSPSCDDDKLSTTDNIESEEVIDENLESDLLENDMDDDDEICSEFDMTVIDSLNWCSENTDSVPKLFINFFRFSMAEFAHIGEVISIRTLKPRAMSAKRWNTQVKAVENPVRPKINLTRTIGSMQTFEYIRKCFAVAYSYLTSIPLLGQRKVDHAGRGKLYINLKKLDFYFSMKESQLKTSKKFNSIQEMIQQDIFDRDTEAIKTFIERTIVNRRELDMIPITIAKSFDPKQFVPHDFNATTFCWFCKRNGHVKERCPEKIIDTNVNTNLDYVLDERVNFDRGFLELYTQDMISPETAQTHHQVVKELEEVINNGLGLSCLLTLFGSTVNLLGSYDSDLDICMTLEGNLTGRDVDCVGILGNVCKLLETDPNASHLEPVLAARVPIIKFRYKDYDVDLCMYNQCAIHNSHLLRTYVLVDFRLAQLYYLVKRFAKACGIADASRGSLSSYAWSLLVIHFLQHTNPPMLPVLQDPKSGEPKKMVGVGGWNVWFNDDVDSIVMPLRATNLTSLFKEFLLYYTGFDFSRQVVSIRTSQVISKFQKNWHNCMIAIEDPFELTYNLSGRLDDQMATYIMKSFPRAYQHICNLQNKCWSQNVTYPRLHIIKRVFEGSSIMSHQPPYRGCRRCHKIGHRVADCPYKNNDKKQPTNKAQKVKGK